MVWRAPIITRVDEEFAADERTTLDGLLDYNRDTLLHKCAGLTGEQLARQSVPPSNLSLLGLLRHMTEVERGWFRRRFARTDLPHVYVRQDNQDADFEEATGEHAERDYQALVRERALCKEAVAGVSLDDTFTHPKYGDMSLRWI
ncbi:MAG TPA: DUF664 domain-containing protein, partial [Pseudonocardiaceae bacterium]